MSFNARWLNANADVQAGDGKLEDVPLESIEVFTPDHGLSTFSSAGTLDKLWDELLALRSEVQWLKDQLETADYDLIEARQDLKEARRKLAEVDG